MGLFPRAARPSRRPARRSRPEPSLAPHAFDADAELAADFWGRRTCRFCRHTGVDGDAQHPLGALPYPGYPPVPAEVMEFEARRIGDVA